MRNGAVGPYHSHRSPARTLAGNAGTPQTGPRELLPDLDQRAPFGLTIAGTKLGFASATDNVGVTAVEIMVRDVTQGGPNFNKYWNGSTWVTAFTWLTPGATLGTPGGTSTTWSYSQNLAVGSYAFSVRAKDAAGNFDATRPWVTFTVS